MKTIRFSSPLLGGEGAGDERIILKAEFEIFLASKEATKPSTLLKSEQTVNAARTLARRLACILLSAIWKMMKLDFYVL